MKSFAVVAVGYNRPDCLLRLLTSLNNADYCGDRVPLIISIDNSGNNDVIQVAKNFAWMHGEKFIRTFPERLGLRKHILTCGDLTQEYQTIAVFEDDLYASDSFYRFAKTTSEFYKNNDRIAGIALYSHHWDQNSNRPFLPINDQNDVYFMQYACSWGQVWSKDNWDKFIDWYKNNNEELLSSSNIPENVVRWPASSWLKYHIKYCIETNRFFVYPKVSLSTNFSSEGQHNIKNSNGYQVPLQFQFRREYILPKLDESLAKYDAFFELINIGDYLGLNNQDVCVDLYGMKNNNSNQRYWLTLKSADYKIMQSYDMSMRPHEMNVINNIDGNIIKLYDTNVKRTFGKAAQNNMQKLTVEYDVKNISYKVLIKYCITTILERIKGKACNFLSSK